MSALAQSLVELTDPKEAARQIAALNMRLAREHEITTEIAVAVQEIVSSISETDLRRWLEISQELETHVLTAALDAQRALADRDEESRDRLRSALARLSQALDLIAEGALVSPDRDLKELARWLVDAVDVPQRELASLLDVPLRSFQRWVSHRESARPEGEEADRLRTVAVVVNQLRFSLSSSGVLHWFDARNVWLRRKTPHQLLSDPLARPRLVAAAQALREGGGT